MPNQGESIWDNPYYASQQQLMTGANLTKNLNTQALLGLLLGTGLGTWGGYQFGNWRRNEDLLKYMTNKLTDQGYTNVMYDKDTRRFSGVDANGNTLFWRRNGDLIPQQTQAVNPAIKAAIPNSLFGEVDLGYQPQRNPYHFPLAAENVPNAFKFNPQRFNDWRNFGQPTNNFFPKTPTQSTVQPTQPILPRRPVDGQTYEDWYSKNPAQITGTPFLGR